MKRIICVTMICMMMSCSSGATTNETAATAGESATKYLASNVLFSTAEAATGETIDTETQVLASNILLDGEVSLGTDAENVQEAMEDVVPDLSSTIVGTWAITGISNGSYDNDPGFTSNGGTITFNSDGSFDVSGATSDGVFSQELGAYSTLTATENASYSFSTIDNMVLVMRIEYTNYSSCSTDNCTADQYNNGNNCTCGGGGQYHDAPCVGGCSGFTSESSQSYVYYRHMIYKSTASTISLGSAILTKQQ